MTRAEILQTAKPILFKTETVRTILDGRKTVTRRILKTQKYIPDDAVFGYTGFTPKGYISCRGTFLDKNGNNRYGESFIKIPYQKGDILYIKETWKQATYDPAGGGYALTDMYLYKADEHIDTTGMNVEDKWHPSIHMPKEATRIFLRVTDVRVERLQDMTISDQVKEGFPNVYKESALKIKLNDMTGAYLTGFIKKWNDSFHGKDYKKYCWDSNPWVWVIEFERVEVSE